MSNSSDGRPPRRPPAPSVRPLGPRAPETGWHDGGDDGWPQEQSRAPGPRQDTGAGGDDTGRDPRTGLSTFDFHPSPLQPRGPQRQAAPVPPPPAGVHGRLPQRPEDLLESGGGEQPLEVARASSVARREPETTALSAPTRVQRSSREMAHAPIVPAGSVTGRSLTLVIAIMCFLACLTAGAVYLMKQSANAWVRDIASEVTVQLEARDKGDGEKTLRDVVAFLGRQPGVTAAKPLSIETSAALLEPWLGQAEGLKSLPVPRLVAVEIDRTSPPDIGTLRQALTAQFKNQTLALDDHSAYLRQIRTLTWSFLLGGVAILVLVAAATTAIIVSATRSAMASNKDIVEVLHYVGATDRFIASQFQRHFLWLGIRAGIIGAGLAGLGFVAMPVAMDVLGGGSASVTELKYLIGTGALDLIGYAWLGMVVVVVAALCMFTSRIGVYRMLHNQH